MGQHSDATIEPNAAKKSKMGGVSVGGQPPQQCSYSPVCIAALSTQAAAQQEMEDTREQLRIALAAEASKETSPLLESINLSLDNDDVMRDESNWLMEYKMANPSVRKRMIDELAESFIETKYQGSLGVVEVQECSRVVDGELKKALVNHLDLQLCCLVDTRLGQHPDYLRAAPTTVLEAIGCIATAFANRTSVVSAKTILAMR